MKNTHLFDFVATFFPDIFMYHLVFKVCLLLMDLIVLSMDKQLATFSDGCLGSNTDEGRSEV